MANLFNLLKPSAKLPRNGFDLSQRHLFTAAAGELLPICPIDCVPGDHHEINVLEMARTNAVHTDAFVRMKQHFEFYFVPYTQLWNPFNEFIATREDGWSTQISPNFDGVPYVKIENMLVALYTMNRNYGPYYFHLDGALKLLDYLGYGAYYCLEWNADDSGDFLDGVEDYLGNNRNINVNLFRLLSYQKIFADYYRNSVYDTQVYIGQATAGYGKSYKYTYNLDFISGNNASHNILDFVNEYNEFQWYFNMHYRQWKKDMFTGLYPDTQFGAVSKAPLSNFILQTLDDTLSSTTGNVDALSTILRVPSGTAGVSKTVGFNSGNTGAQPVQHYLTFSSPAAVDVLQLLKAEALQKWRQSTMLAGNRTEDQWEAHYGTKPRFHRDTRCQFVGAFDSYIGLNEVVATNSNNDPSTNPLGDIGAHGVGTADGKITFDCQDFGTLLCIYSVTPSAEYNAFMCDSQNFNIEHFDFWTPEFQNLGMQVVTSPHYDMGLVASTPQSNVRQFFTLGYAPRYWAYKTAVDKAHGQFMSARSSQQYKDGSKDFATYGDAEGIYSHWCSPRRIINEDMILGQGTAEPYSLTLGALYIHPDSLDTVFVQKYDGTPQTDQFLVNAYFDVKSVRNMSVLGLPQF